ncbi:MAG: MgtC/SapB family protein [Candidatus Aenigmatarchaeota archaeon]
MLTNILFAQKIFISLLLGVIVGLEREKRVKVEAFAGVRTFTLVSFLGFLSVYISQDVVNSNIPIILSFSTVAVLTALSYVYKILKSKHQGLTTEIAFIITFIVGILIYFQNYPYFLPVSITIIMTFILAAKERLHHAAHHITRKEIWSALIFGIIAFVLFPLIPNTTFDPWNAINPHMVWLSAVLVLSMSFVGYIAMKIFGARVGLELTGIFGGLASSTAVSIDMAEKVKRNKRILYSASFAVIFASSTMFLRSIAIAYFFNQSIGISLLAPFILFGITGYLLSFLILRKSLKERPSITIGSPISLKPVFKFAIFFSFILLISRIGQLYFGQTGIYLASFFGGLIDIDASLISIITLASTSSLPVSTATSGIIIAGISNTISKLFLIKFLGSSSMVKEVGKVFAVLIAQGLIILFLIGL